MGKNVYIKASDVLLAKSLAVINFDTKLYSVEFIILIELQIYELVV